MTLDERITLACWVALLAVLIGLPLRAFILTWNKTRAKDGIPGCKCADCKHHGSTDEVDVVFCNNGLALPVYMRDVTPDFGCTLGERRCPQTKRKS